MGGVERTFSDMKMVKTRLRSRLGKDTLDYVLHMCIESPDTLDDKKLKCIFNHWKQQKKLHCSVIHNTFNTIHKYLTCNHMMNRIVFERF